MHLRQKCSRVDVGQSGGRLVWQCECLTSAKLGGEGFLILKGYGYGGSGVIFMSMFCVGHKCMTAIYICEWALTNTG